MSIFLITGGFYVILIVVSVQIIKTVAEKSETGFPQPAVAPVFTECFGFLQGLCDKTQKSAHR